MKPGREHVTIAVSGAHGGKTIDFRELAQQGMILVGLTQAFNNGVASFQPNLLENLAISRGMKTPTLRLIERPELDAGSSLFSYS